jgi:hypothetical protein
VQKKWLPDWEHCWRAESKIANNILEKIYNKPASGGHTASPTPSLIPHFAAAVNIYFTTVIQLNKHCAPAIFQNVSLIPERFFADSAVICIFI